MLAFQNRYRSINYNTHQVGGAAADDVVAADGVVADGAAADDAADGAVAAGADAGAAVDAAGVGAAVPVPARRSDSAGGCASWCGYGACHLGRPRPRCRAGCRAAAPTRSRSNPPASFMLHVQYDNINTALFTKLAPANYVPTSVILCA